MFKTIIWATDGSEAADHALPYAQALALGGGDANTLVVLHAVEYTIGVRGGGPAYFDEDEIKTKIEAQAATLMAAGVNATLKVADGAAANTIAETAREISADLVILGTRGHTAIAGLLLGGVTQRLLHLAPCPVFVVPARIHSHLVDGETAAETGSEVAMS